MPNWTKLVAGWALAALIAVVFSWGAVSQVRNRVIQPTVEIPTTNALAVTTPAETTTTTTPPVVRLEPELVESTTTTTAAKGADPETTQGTATTPTTTAPSTSTSTTSPPATTSITTTQPPATTSTTTTQPPSTTTTTTVPQQTQTSSYPLLGGVVTVSHSPGVVVFVSAIPQPGFSTDPRETGPGEVRVRFESADHTSDFRARWDDGELRITRNETGES